MDVPLDTYHIELQKQSSLLLAPPQRGVSGDRLIDLESWLPITAADRSANWKHAAFHNVTAMMGAGVLALPNAMVYLTWGPGILMLILSWIITLFTLWQMVEMHEAVPGRRFDRYHELGQEAFGPKLGLWIVVPMQLVVEVGVDIVYMVTAGKSLQHAYSITCGDHCQLQDSIVFWIFLFAIVQLVLAQLPNFNSIAAISLAAAIMSISYSTIAWAIPAHYGHTLPGNIELLQPVSYDFPPFKPVQLVQAGGSAVQKAPEDLSTADRWFGAFTALGTIAFAYAGHNVVLEIQSTLPSTPHEPSKIAMWRGVKFAYGVVAIGYFPVALIGYWAYGNQVTDDIITFVSRPTWLVVIANLMVVVHVIGSYQIYAMPVYDMLESTLVGHLRFNPSMLLRLVTRSLYVSFTMFVAMTFPFFAALLGFFGGFAFSPTTYFAVIVFGVVLMFVSTIGGFRSLMTEAANFHFYT
uniref:Amino acid transporter transmembrane domain-containing protein n=1 Tax=Physcomitrium patens TaxID=3218 RepID=A0A7I4B5R3_PHYPA